VGFGGGPVAEVLGVSFSSVYGVCMHVASAVLVRVGLDPALGLTRWSINPATATRRPSYLTVGAS
jgi:hypothetical protein